MSLEQKKQDIVIQYKKQVSTKIVWPPSSSNGPLRTRNDIQDIYDQISNSNETLGPPLEPHELKGIQQPSLLFNVPNFDFIHGIPTEYLHSVCIGLIKKFIELTFNVGETRKRVTKRELSSSHQFNSLIANQQVPR